MTKTSQNITVIGAGINGLVTANYLARAGHQVTLLERNDRVGGACVSETVEVAGHPAGLRARRFYQFGEFENVSICGSSTCPCGSVAGTPGYMCVSELQRKFGR